MTTARKIFQWIDETLPSSSWGSGSSQGSRIADFIHDGHRHVAFTIYTYGKIEIRFGRLKRVPPYDSLEKRLELIKRLNEIQGVNIAERSADLYPSFDIAALNNEPELARFYAVMSWLVDEIKICPSLALALSQVRC